MQSLEKRTVVIVGTRYAGEMKKSIFYAMNFDLPAMGVFPMHCSCNVDKHDPSSVAIFFGLSGTGKTTLSADPHRSLVGDDEHGWSPDGVFNVEGGCYAKCIKLSREGEPEIWNAIRFGSVLENVVIDEQTREPDYDDNSRTENTRVTYPVEFIEDARIPSVAGHPRNVIFLTADAYGVLPPVSRLSPEQAQYYFVNGYTSKLAGTEAGVTEPQPNFSPCFGGPFLPRPPKVYADWLARRVEEHHAHVWLLNTGWTGGPYGVGSRFKLAWTRAFVQAILDGSLADVPMTEHPVFGLQMPTSCPGVPSEVLDPRNTWRDPVAYDAGHGTRPPLPRERRELRSSGGGACRWSPRLSQRFAPAASAATTTRASCRKRPRLCSRARPDTPAATATTRGPSGPRPRSAGCWARTRRSSSWPPAPRPTPWPWPP